MLLLADPCVTRGARCTRLKPAHRIGSSDIEVARQMISMYMSLFRKVTSDADNLELDVQESKLVGAILVGTSHGTVRGHGAGAAPNRGPLREIVASPRLTRRPVQGSIAHFRTLRRRPTRCTIQHNLRFSFRCVCLAHLSALRGHPLARRLKELRRKRREQVSHAESYRSSTQALALLQQVSDARTSLSDRFYRALYSKVPSAQVRAHKNPSAFLNIVYRAMKKDDKVRPAPRSAHMRLIRRR